jgi:exopolysaccharide biosynthesis polyprenyl glycosylphosphotransferase
MESSVAQAEQLSALEVAAADAGVLEAPTLEAPTLDLEAIEAIEAPAPETRWGARRSSVLARSLASSDLVMCLVACEMAALATGVPTREAFAFAAASGLVFPLIMFFLGVYSVEDLRAWASGVVEAPKALVGAIAFAWPLFGAADLLHAPSPALTAGLAVALTILLTMLARSAVRASLHRADPMRQRTVIIGSGEVAGQLVDKLRVHRQFGLEPVGLIDDDFHEVGAPDLPRLGGLRDLPAILEAGRADRVIIAFSRASHQELLSCIRCCRDHGVAVDIVPRLFEFLVGARSLDTVGGLPLLSLGTARLTASSRVAKRGLDLAASALLLALLAPLWLLIAIAIRLESKGPVLFRQPRVGRNGKEFDVFKFRTMYTNAELRLTEEGVMVKTPHDPRITKVGQLLRRFSLDELPQLLNVLRGEMSLVGPRPLIPQESAALDETWHERRFDLRPGLTGIWQVQGRSENPFGEMVRLDYQYVAGWSLSRDVEILLATIPAVLSGRGAY